MPRRDAHRPRAGTTQERVNAPHPSGVGRGGWPSGRSSSGTAPRCCASRAASPATTAMSRRPVGDVFVALVEGRGRLEPGRDPLPYLRRAVTNRALNLLRRRRRAPRSVPGAVLDALHDDPPRVRPELLPDDLAAGCERLFAAARAARDETGAPSPAPVRAGLGGGMFLQETGLEAPPLHPARREQGARPRPVRRVRGPARGRGARPPRVDLAQAGPARGRRRRRGRRRARPRATASRTARRRA